MIVLTAPLPLSAPTIAARHGVSFVTTATDRWRVVASSGDVIGHLEARATPSGTRYLARRYRPAARGFQDFGSFWNADDAVESLRYAR